MREQLVFKAICVLDEACEQARLGRVPPSFGLRFALAFLYTVGDRRGEWFDREPYDGFWRDATMRDDVGGSVNTSSAGAARQTQLQVHLNAIGRAAGLEIGVPVLEALARARRMNRRD